MEKRFCSLPRCYSVRFELERNPIAQLRHDQIDCEFETVPFTRGKLHGERLTADTQAQAFVVLPRKAKFDQPPSDPTLLTSNGLAPAPGTPTLATWASAAT